MSKLLGASGEAGTSREDQRWLRGDAFALVVAGSDTVASTLVSIFYHIVRDPIQQDRIRSELSGLSSRYDPQSLRDVQHLSGIINEALWLYPALPSGGMRQTPSEGLHIADRYIPGNVVVSAPRYSLGRYLSVRPN
ncbi:hypothetical protein ACLMJK_003833 [Lecanora helva]